MDTLLSIGAATSQAIAHAPSINIITPIDIPEGLAEEKVDDPIVIPASLLEPSGLLAAACYPCNAFCQSAGEECNTCEDFACQYTCEKSCQTACEKACQYLCLNVCQLVCEGTCQATCQKACQNPCQSACQNCQTCQATCQLLCMTGCQVSCQDACEINCQGYVPPSMNAPLLGVPSVSGTDVSVTWNRNNSFGSIRLEFVNNGTGSVVTYTTSSSGSGSWSATGSYGVAYHFRAYCYDNGGSYQPSGWTFTSAVSIPYPNLPAPSFNTPSATGKVVSVTWSRNTSIGSTRVSLRKSSDGSEVAFTNTTGTSWSYDTGSAPTQSYYFTAYNYDPAGNYGTSGWATSSAVFTKLIPQPPTGIYHSYNGNTLTIFFTKGVDATDTELDKNNDGTPDDFTAGTSFTVTSGIPSGTTHTVYLRSANNLHGTVSSWVPYSITTPPAAPQPDYNRLFETGNITLSWLRGSGADETYLKPSWDPTTYKFMTETTKSFTGVYTGAKHTISMYSKNTTSGLTSNTITDYLIIKPAVPTVAIQSVSATNMAVRANATGGYDSSDGATIQISTSSSFASVLQEKSAIVGGLYLFDGLGQGVTYYLRARTNVTIDSTVYTSAWSSTVSQATGSIPTVPSAPTAASYSEQKINLSWGVSTSASTYTLEWEKAIDSSRGTVTGLTGTTYSFTGDYGRVYTFRVKGVNSYGESAYSSWSGDLVVRPQSPPISKGVVTSNTVEVKLDNFSTTFSYVLVELYDGAALVASDTRNTIPNSITFTGLAPSKTYTAKAWTKVTYGTTYTSLSASTLDILTSARPVNFAWTYPKTAGQDFFLAATEWNALTARVNAFLTYKSKSTITFTVAVTGNDFTATIFNEVRNAIAAMPYTIAPPATVAKGDDIYADTHLNKLVNALNSIP